jgi:hypothetical protein
LFFPWNLFYHYRSTNTHLMIPVPPVSMTKRLSGRVWGLILGCVAPGMVRDRPGRGPTPRADAFPDVKVLLHRRGQSHQGPQDQEPDDHAAALPGALAQAAGFKKEALEADIEQIKVFYRTQGFYHTRITPKIIQKNGQVAVTLRIQEGPWVKVTDIEVKGLEAIPAIERRRLREQRPLSRRPLQ